MLGITDPHLLQILQGLAQASRQQPAPPYGAGGYAPRPPLNVFPGPPGTARPLPPQRPYGPAPPMPPGRTDTQPWMPSRPAPPVPMPPGGGRDPGLRSPFAPHPTLTDYHSALVNEYKQAALSGQLPTQSRRRPAPRSRTQRGRR